MDAPAHPKIQFFRFSASMEAPAHPKIQFFRFSALMEAPAHMKIQFFRISALIEVPARPKMLMSPISTSALEVFFNQSRPSHDKDDLQQSIRKPVVAAL